MLCAFHLHCKPRSANNQARQGYTQTIGKAARSQYNGPPVTDALYSRIIWFHKYNSTQGDADNFAKRIHDALKGVLFEDDRVITHTLSMRVDATQEVEIVPDPSYPEPATRLAGSLADDAVRDILYIELGLQRITHVHLDPSHDPATLLPPIS